MCVYMRMYHVLACAKRPSDVKRRTARDALHGDFPPAVERLDAFRSPFRVKVAAHSDAKVERDPGEARLVWRRLVPAEAAEEECDLAVVDVERVEVACDARRGGWLRVVARLPKPHRAA